MFYYQIFYFIFKLTLNSSLIKRLDYVKLHNYATMQNYYYYGENIIGHMTKCEYVIIRVSTK